MKVLRPPLIGLLLLLMVTFSIKNAYPVRVGYFNLIDSFEIPLFLLVLTSVLVGMFIGTMVDLIKRYRLRKAIRSQQRLMGELQKELTSLRNRVFSIPSHTENASECRDDG